MSRAVRSQCSAVVAVVVVDEVDLIGRHKHDVRDDAQRARLAHHQAARAVVVGARRRQPPAAAAAAAAPASAGRAAALQAREVVSGVGEGRVGGDSEVPGVELQVVEAKHGRRRRARHVHLAVAVLHHVHAALQRPEKPDLLDLTTASHSVSTF